MKTWNVILGLCFAAGTAAAQTPDPQPPPTPTPDPVQLRSYNTFVEDVGPLPGQ